MLDEETTTEEPTEEEPDTRTQQARDIDTLATICGVKNATDIYWQVWRLAAEYNQDFAGMLKQTQGLLEAGFTSAEITPKWRRVLNQKTDNNTNLAAKQTRPKPVFTEEISTPETSEETSE